jgi:hypothetical protein
MSKSLFSLVFGLSAHRALILIGECCLVHIFTGTDRTFGAHNPTQTKVLFRREQWKKIVAECQASGLPVKTWCHQNGFKEQSYYYYLKKILELEIESSMVFVRKSMTRLPLALLRGLR